AVGTIHSDGLKLRQCLINLLSNACKFTRNGTVSFRVARVHALDASARRRRPPVAVDAAHEWIRFQAGDTGIGMTAEQQRRIFQPFTQADATIAREFGGTGLGLALAKVLSEHLGGVIDVKSELGAGTTFSLWLPADPDAR